MTSLLRSELSFMLDEFDEWYSYVFIAYCLFYGLTSLFDDWESFGSKLSNILFIVAFVVLVFIIIWNEGFFEGLGVGIAGFGAHWLGFSIGEDIKDDDYTGIFLILSILALVAMFIGEAVRFS